VGEFSTERVMQPFKFEATAKTFWNSWDEMIAEERPRFCLGTVSDCNYLFVRLVKPKAWHLESPSKTTHLAVLHDIELS
jgi:hypothetical protein